MSVMKPTNILEAVDKALGSMRSVFAASKAKSATVASDKATRQRIVSLRRQITTALEPTRPGREALTGILHEAGRVQRAEGLEAEATFLAGALELARKDFPSTSAGSAEKVSPVAKPALTYPPKTATAALPATPPAQTKSPSQKPIMTNPTSAKPTGAAANIGRQPGEPSAAVLTALAHKLVGHVEHDYSKIDASFNVLATSLGQIEAINFEMLRDTLYKTHISVKGLSYERSAARTSRPDFPISTAEVSKIDSMQLYTDAFMAHINGEDTTSREYANNFSRAGVSAAKSFLAQQQREAAHIQRRLAAAQAEKVKAAQQLAAQTSSESELQSALAQLSANCKRPLF